MNSQSSQPGLLRRADLAQLINRLSELEYTCIGPVLENHAISYKVITSVDQITSGIEIGQAAGSYTVKQVDHQLRFSWSNGAQAIKPYLFEPEQTLWQCVHNANGQLEFVSVTAEIPNYAFIGVRACDLAALAIQDKHFIQGQAVESRYQALRESSLFVGVDCFYPSSNCFCVAMHSGPEISGQFDIALSELESGFIVRTGSERGQQVCSTLPLTEPTEQDWAQRKAKLKHARAAMHKSIPAGNLHAQMVDKLSDKHWEKIAERCLSCGNCTAVCPTCFCFKEYDQPSLSQNDHVHQREWSSCFAAEHSYIHGYQVRSQVSHRYRQWLTHKFGYWNEQYGESGCVGCGRCISWCPVGIDVTEEINEIVCGTAGC